MAHAALRSVWGEGRLVMTHCKLSLLLAAVLIAWSLAAQSQSADPCTALAGLKIDGVEITKAALVPAGTTIPPPYPGAQGIGPLPAHYRVDGIINRRKGVDGQEFGIGFALALPEAATWNGDFMMQGPAKVRFLLLHLGLGVNLVSWHQQRLAQRFQTLGSKENAGANLEQISLNVRLRRSLSSVPGYQSEELL